MWAALVDAAARSMTAPTISCRQMGSHIAGWRLSTGAWPQPNRQQTAFAGYDPAATRPGDLDTRDPQPAAISPSANELIAAEREAVDADRDRAITLPARRRRRTDRELAAGQRQRRCAQFAPGGRHVNAG